MSNQGEKASPYTSPRVTTDRAVPSPLQFLPSQEETQPRDSPMLSWVSDKLGHARESGEGGVVRSHSCFPLEMFSQNQQAHHCTETSRSSTDDCDIKAT